METRKLGWTDLEFTTICLGTWAIGGPWEIGWGPQDDEVSIATIREAIEKGINCIDTAPIYGLGHSEEVVGSAIQGLAKKPYICTKFSRVGVKNGGEIIPDMSRASIRSEVEDSLRRLRVDVIDLYQMHRPIPDEQIEEGWETVAGLVKEGKVRYVGVSNTTVEQMKRLQPIHPIASAQPPYSMFQREIEKVFLPYCAEQNIGVIVYSPVQKGLLTGHFSKERRASLPPDDNRQKDPTFQEPQLSINLQAVEELRPIAEKRGESVGRLAIDWVLRRPEVTSAIVGARNPRQIDENIQGPGTPLSSQDVEEIEQVLEKREKALAGT